VKCLTAFSSVFSGKHIKYKDIVKVIEGKEVKVEFDTPSILQYDGETITGVQEYTVNA
jgi:diacylglycerol kinase family enzyme